MTPRCCALRPWPAPRGASFFTRRRVVDYCLVAASL